MTQRLLRGSRQSYDYLAERFGDLFTSLHRWHTFKKKLDCEAIVPFYQERSGDNLKHGTQRVYRAADLEKWFAAGFPGGTVPSVSNNPK